MRLKYEPSSEPLHQPQTLDQASIEDLSPAETAELTTLQEKYQGDLAEQARTLNPKSETRSQKP